MILTVTANPTLDKNYLVPGFTLTGIHRVENMSIVPAGKGLNVSRVLKTLGVPTMATGIVGGHTGKQIESSLRKLGVPHDFVQIRDESRSIALIIDHHQGIHTEVQEPGPTIPLGAWKRLEKKIMQLASGCDWVVFAGSPPPGSPHTLYAELIRSVKSKGVKVALDAKGPWLREGVKAGPNLIKPNWEEFQELVGPCYSTVQALEKAQELVEDGIVGTVVVTMGSKGAMAVDRQQCYLIQELPPIQVASPIGSGDTMMAGLLSKLNASWDFAPAFRFAVAAATSNASHFGAGIIDLEQIATLEQELVVEQIQHRRDFDVH